MDRENGEIHLKLDQADVKLDPADEAEDLARQIVYHDYLYWEKNSTEISDAEYDRLRHRLKELNPKHPQLAIIGERTRWKDEFHPPAQHSVPMLSINKEFDVEKAIKWARDAGALKERIQGSSEAVHEQNLFDTHIQPEQSDDDGVVACFKVDGSSCSLVYKNGELLRAVTRGNGKIGNDVTLNVRRIASVPKNIGHNANVEVRGEIYLTLEAYEDAITEQKLDPNKTNPRNLCAGTLIQNDPREVGKARLSFMAHGCVGVPPGSSGKSEMQNLQALKSLGFDTPLYKCVKTAEEFEQTVKEIDEVRDSLAYETDGIVFTINRIALQHEMGSTSHHPRFRLAFKFGRQQGETRAIGFIWHTTRTGRVSPTLKVEPIRLGGAIVQLCTLHNAKFVEELKVNVGDTVMLEREVIPHIVGVTKKGPKKEADLPKRCDVCDFELNWDANEVNLVCENKGGCHSQIEDYLEYYVSRGATNMKGIGEQLVRKLFNLGLLKTPADFFRLTKEQLMNLEVTQSASGRETRFREVSATNIIKAIQGQREQTLETFLVSLGIPRLGRTIASRLASRFGTLDSILHAGEDDLMTVENFAEIMAKTIYKGLHNRKKVICDLLKEVKIVEAQKVDGPLSGKSFCLTGHVEFEFGGKKYDARPDIEKLIESQGGAIKSVSKALNYLVVGDDPGSKVEKAKKAGVTILDAAGLVKLLENK